MACMAQANQKKITQAPLVIFIVRPTKNGFCRFLQFTGIENFVEMIYIMVYIKECL
jgi:hypothetical protein